MRRTECLREAVSKWPNSDEIRERASSGWRLAAIEWEREVEEAHAPPAPDGLAGEEIPFGTRIAGDCVHLEHRDAQAACVGILFADAPPRFEIQFGDGGWFVDQLDLAVPALQRRVDMPRFVALTPRLIEVAPRILSGAEWDNRKKQLSRVAWNS